MATFRSPKLVFLLLSHSIWPEKYRGYISKSNDCHLQGNAWRHGGIQHRPSSSPLAPKDGSFLTSQNNIYQCITTPTINKPPEMCFWSEVGFLGFIVQHRGTEINPAKIRAIVELPPPNNIWELKGLQATLSISKGLCRTCLDNVNPFPSPWERK